MATFDDFRNHQTWQKLLKKILVHNGTCIELIPQIHFGYTNPSLLLKASTGPGSFSTTPLHLASENNHVECLRILLKYNALVDPLRGHRERETPLQYVSNETKKKTSNFHMCLSNFIPNFISEMHVFSLSIACHHGYFEVAKTLLQKGADPNAKNGNGQTSLHLSSKVLASSLIALLIERGADVEATDIDGRPPLHYVINSRHSGGSRECMR